jgi:predicted PurR-regulated permease PerM
MKRYFTFSTVLVLASLVLVVLGFYIVCLLFPYVFPAIHIIFTVLFPLFVALILAYLLNPMVKWLTLLKLQRLYAVILLYLIFISVLGLSMWYGGPVLIQETQEVIAKLPEIESMLQAVLHRFDYQMRKLPDGIHQTIDQSVQGFESMLQAQVSMMIEGIGMRLGQIFSILVIPFLVFYLLLDAERIYRRFFMSLPKRYQKSCLKLWKKIDSSLGEYIRGQLMISFIVGLIIYVGYLLIGLPYALFLAVIAALFNIIPYFGPILGAIPAVVVAFLTNPILVLWVILINLLGQLVEGNVLGPIIVGKRLHIHPIALILVLLLGAELAGVWGLILAVPFYVMIRVVISHIIHSRMNLKIDRA